MQSVPISVAAVSGESLERQKITNIAGLANSIPNVQINQWANSPDSAVFTIRGVGVNDPDPYVGTTVSVVVDGVVVGVNTAALSNLFDIERVEILRGPQGTLFGANTTGGVINVVTKQPTGEFGGEAQVTYGNYNRLELNAAVNFPLADHLAGKISVLHTGRDGYFKNVLTGANLGKVDMTNLRAYLKFDGGSAYNATLIGEYGRSRNDSQTNLNLSDSSLLIYDPVYSSPNNKGYSRGQSTDQPNYNNRDSYSATLTQNIGTGLGDIVSITNYRSYNHDLYSDDDAVPAVLLQSRRQIKHEQYSQELRDTVNLTDAVQMIFGGFAFHQKYSLIQGTKLDGFALGLGQPQTQRQRSTSLSAFSQLYAQLTDKLRLQAGLRYAYLRHGRPVRAHRCSIVYIKAEKMVSLFGGRERKSVICCVTSFTHRESAEFPRV
nr:TonB-dependent receptor plug domain-containing protein [Aquisediminimonas sediminicola]